MPRTKKVTIEGQGTLKAWYYEHFDDYKAVKERLSAVRNVVLNGPVDRAADVMGKSIVNSVLSIQTDRDRHERAFTAHYAGDISLEEAAEQTVYGYQKADWLTSQDLDTKAEKAVLAMREGGHESALEYLADDVKGLSWSKAGFTLAMCGIWEVACPDSRTQSLIGYEGRVRTRDDYFQALDMIDERLDVDEHLFVKQWCIYDKVAGEHARHMPFFREVINI